MDVSEVGACGLNRAAMIVADSKKNADFSFSDVENPGFCLFYA